MGPFGYLLKPIRNRDIKPTIDMALYKKEMEMGLQKAHRELGKQVEERTAELSEANRNLKREIRVRKKAEVALMGSLEKLSAEHDKRVFLSKQLIDLLERERKQLSMDLHDDVGQVLTGIKMATEIMLDEMKKRDDELTGEMALLKERTTHLIKKIRDFSRLLRPNILERFGLIASFKQLFAGIEKDSRLRIHLFTSGGEERFDNEKELACFRIVQEALNNIINHAGAKEVFVNFVKKDKMLSLSVEDDGAGFEPENINHITDGKGPLGILIMEERAQKAGGTFSIDSQVGRGTRVMVEMLGV